jgi:hypothetical protein
MPDPMTPARPLPLVAVRLATVPRPRCRPGRRTGELVPHRPPAQDRTHRGRTGLLDENDSNETCAVQITFRPVRQSQRCPSAYLLTDNTVTESDGDTVDASPSPEPRHPYGRPQGQTGRPGHGR